jgi:uncharacterized cupin superfamily protein
MMKLGQAAIVCLWLIPATSLLAAEPKPSKVSAAEAGGPVFQRPDAVQETHGGRVATDVPLMQSGDHRFTAGLYKSGPADFQVKSYPVDEFCYFLSGSVTLTTSDGTVIEVKAGEAVSLPKGWKGRWQTQGYTKYYVEYGEPPSK